MSICLKGAAFLCAVLVLSVSVVRWCTVGRDLQVWVVGFLITSIYLRCWDTALIGASFCTAHVMAVNSYISWQGE